jgi:hypothetical protein
MNRPAQTEPSRKRPAVWLPWVVLFLTAAWGEATLRAHLAPPPPPAAGPVQGEAGSAVSDGRLG